MPVKFVKKALRSGKRFVKKRYGIGKKRTLNVGALAKDVARMAMMINAEKKVYAYKQGTTFSIGQSAGAALSGAGVVDVSPLLAINAAVDGRIGNSVKFCSAFYQFQISHQANAVTDNVLLIDLWINKGTTLSTADTLTNVFSPSTFSGLIDSNSPRNQDHFNNWQLVRSYRRKLKADATSGELVVSTFNIPVKFNKGKGHHIRYASSSSTNPLLDIQNGQMCMTFRAQNGNASAVTVASSPIPITAVSTAMNVNFAYKIWYYDN